MARSFSDAKLLSEVVAKAINRRGFSVSATQAAAAANARAPPRAGPSIVQKTAGEEVVGSTEKASWVPDPRTGFYRPENSAEELDAAELRAMLLKKH